ncbi:phospholipase C type enzyme [Naganishia albida]|nr:phospholipase C type enzyme [Naganishia albida]
MSNPPTLSVLTLNVWGLKFISKDRTPRIAAIAEYLATHADPTAQAGTGFDIVCLQECWVQKDFDTIKTACKDVFPYSRYFHTGALGSGLAILTKFPIISAQALPYSLSGLPLAVIAGDFFVNKAAGSVAILHPELGEVEIWNTHMHAAGEGGPQTQQAHRMAQAWQLANAIRAAAERGRYVIATGDFNSSPQSLPIAILRDQGCLLDSWLMSHPESLTAAVPQTDEEGIQVHGMTVDNLLNSYSAGKPLVDEAKKWKGKRLDYIFYRGPDVARRRPLMWTFKGKGNQGGKAPYHDHDTPGSHHVGSNANDHVRHLEEGPPIAESMESAPILTCQSCRVVLTDLVPGKPYSYSDHFGLLATFAVLPPDAVNDPLTNPEAPQHRPLPTDYNNTAPLVQIASNEASASQPDVSRTKQESSSRQTAINAFFNSPTKAETIRNAIDVLNLYSGISARNSRFQLRLFGLSICAALALTISSAWQPKSYIQPIWTLLGVATGALGATMLYVGFVWGRWEANLLKEIIAQMELDQAVAELEIEARR